jgi:chromosome segregation ATPase
MLKMLNGTQTQRDWAQTHLFDRLAALRSRVEQLEAQLSKAVEQRESLEETRKHLLYTRELITTQRDSARAMGRRLRDVLLSVQEAHESSRKAVSKGSAQYDALFLWALYGGDVVAALDETKGLEEP